MSNDVLIVGAGPTGLLLAAGLARYGIKPRLIDRNPQPSQTSKAIGVFARTLELFEDLGVAEEAIAQGIPIRAFNVHIGNKQIELDLQQGKSFLPTLVVLPQSQTEAILEQLVEQSGITIERSVELTDLEQDNQGVIATLTHADGHQEQCYSQWLIGCDGAGSTVRKAARISDEGKTIPSLAVLADVEAEIPLANDEFHAFVSGEGIVGIIPLSQQNCWRLIADLPPEKTIADEPDLSLFEEMARTRANLQIALKKSIWTSSFRFRQRMVSECRKGRIFVAGDALSSHSPVGGQGMNTGLQDAYNLAWKLALVIRNQASAELLDSYQAERLPISKTLLMETEFLTRGILQRNPVVGQIRGAIATVIARVSPIQQQIINTLSELNINYRNSPIVQNDPAFLFSLHTQQPSLKNWLAFRNGPKAGERTPDIKLHTPEGKKRLFQVLSNSLKHTLLLFAGTTLDLEHLHQIVEKFSNAFPDKLLLYVVLPTTSIPETLSNCVSVLLDPEQEGHHCYGATGACWYLIRPDGYIGCRSQSMDCDRLKIYFQILRFH